ncbi:MAG: IS21 family transposase [Desulfobacterales bacterium]|nr:IS21 family transposase [Desulfobacterales bacterium]
MRKIREVLRLKHEHSLANRIIARSCCVGRSTVAEYLRRAEEAGLSWPLPPELDDAQLDRRLFPPPPAVPAGSRPLPDWVEVHRELRLKGVTLFLLWEEYKQTIAEGYQYSWFCQQYRRWAEKVDVVMRQEHRAGEKLFVDYAGQTVPVVDPTTGEIREAQVFIAVLGASNYTYAEATWTQTLPDWIGSHVRALTFFGGVSELIVPDNLKSGVSKACFYEPDLNPTYQDMASHYGCAVIPARVRAPRDKAKVEVGVQVVERWILARFRKSTFFGLTELNAAIRQLLDQLNERPFNKLPGCRRTLYETLDKPALRPLPQAPYVYAEWKKARVNIDYHVQVEGHFYSVPYQLVKHQLDIRITRTTVEAFLKSKRVASHIRSYQKGGYTTVKEHMPKAHQAYLDWTPQRLIRWAAKIGSSTAQVVETVLCSRPHPQQGYRSCLGIMRLGKVYAPQRLEAACTRALAIGALSYKSIEAILKNGLDKRPLPTKTQETAAIVHENIRGPHYYH